MGLLNIFYSYIHYLIHPFKTHEFLVHPDRYEGFKPVQLSAYESLTTSWVFVIISGIFRVIMLNFIILLFVDILEDSSFNYSQYIDIKEFPTFYFIILSSILDIIFYPLFGIIIIQFWEVIIKFYGTLLGTTGDLSAKAQNIISVYFSSSILTLIPVFGATAQSLASMILMYAGLRKQLNASPVLSICIILTPFVLVLGLLSILLLMILVFL